MEIPTVAARYVGGASILALAKECGVSPWKMRRSLVSLGVEVDSKRRNPHNKLSPTDTKKAKELYESGLTFEEVGRRLGRSDIGIIYALRREHPEIIRPNSGPQSTRWKGGRNHSHGYVYVWIASDDPLAKMRTTTGYVAEHRLNLARKLGRPLRPSETVHHLDGNRLNNDPANLQLRQGRHGKGTVMCCLECGSANVGFQALD